MWHEQGSQCSGEGDGDGSGDGEGDGSGDDEGDESGVGEGNSPPCCARRPSQLENEGDGDGSGDGLGDGSRVLSTIGNNVDVEILANVAVISSEPIFHACIRLPAVVRALVSPDVMLHASLMSSFAPSLSVARTLAHA